VIGRWCSLGTPVSFTNKTHHNDIAEILWKVTLNTIALALKLSNPKKSKLKYNNDNDKEHYILEYYT
jgi:hypothetical protein